MSRPDMGKVAGRTVRMKDLGLKLHLGWQHGVLPGKLEGRAEEASCTYM